MKTLYSRVLLLLAALWLYGCGSKSKDDPKPKTYHIQARVTGQNLSGLGAEFHLTSSSNGTGRSIAGPTVDQVYTTATVGATYEIGDFETESLIEGVILLRNVTRTSQPRPSASMQLKLEMLADGRVINSVYLDANGAHTNGGYGPFLSGSAAVETEDL